MSKIENRIMLTGQWQAESVPNPILMDASDFRPLTFPATVPGSTLQDLIAAGIADADVFWRDHAERVQQYEAYNWKYTKVFSLDAIPASAVELVFERLDTYAAITLNGIPVGQTDNGYIEHRFPVRELLCAGKNTLEVLFTSPINDTLNRPALPGAFTTERLYNRRIQCTYGWDWTMRFVTTGIYGDCYLASPAASVSVKDVYLYTAYADSENATIGVDVELAETSGSGILRFCIYAPNGECVRSYDRFCKEAFFRFRLDIASPELWYPAGYGEQPLYRFSVTYEGISLFEETFGIRTVTVMQLPDMEGSAYASAAERLKTSAASQHYDKNEESSGFILKVNGVKILCKGANWVPCAPFEMPGIEEKIGNILSLAADAGVNMLRVWGGGYLEKKCFYEECSRRGILVVQDFFMACGAYPEKEEWFIRGLNAEAEYTVRTLRNQAALMWWHGDNENAVDGSDTDPDYRGRDSAYRGLAPLIWQLDPQRPFFPSSPYGGKTYASNTVGTTHNTQFLSFIFSYIEEQELQDYKAYIDSLNARFVSEEPIFGAASRAALRRMMTDEDILGEDLTMWKYHTQTNPALDRHLLDYYSTFAQKIFGAYTDGEDRLAKWQYLQCELVRTSMERTRREKWFSSGVIYWMLSDCWPAASGWSIIDYYASPKPAYYAFRRTALPVIASFCEDADGQITLTVTHDGNTAPTVSYRVSRVQDAEAVQSGEWTALTEPLQNEARVVERFSLGAGEILIADVTDGKETCRTFYRRGGLAMRRAGEDAYDATVESGGVTVRAGAYLQAVILEAADAETVWSDNCFTMLPGETRHIDVLKGSAADVRVVAYRA